MSIQEELNSAADAWNAWERFVMTITSLTGVIIGVVLWIKPEPIEDFPYRQVVAAAVCGFSGLFAFALIFGKTSAGMRVKCLLVSIAAGAIAGACGYALVPTVMRSRDLANGGHQTMATVERAYSRGWGENRSRSVLIAYDKHHHTISYEAKTGAKFPVLYLKNEPKTVVVGEQGVTAYELVCDQIEYPSLFVAMMLLTGIASLVYLKAVFTGPTEGMVE